MDRTLLDLAAIGSGWPGTKGEALRRDYVMESLHKLGHKTDREHFVHLTCSPDAFACCSSDQIGEIAAVPILYTKNDTMVGPLVALGEGSRDDFARLDAASVSIESKIVVARTDAPASIDEELERRGVAGLVLQSSNRAPSAQRVGRRFPPPLRPPWDKAVTTYPGVAVGGREGELLLAAHANGDGLVTIGQGAAYFEASSDNVVARLCGDTREFMVVATHYDTCPGEDASSDYGVAILLELAELFRDRRPSVGMRFVAFACGKLGMWGSHAYVQRHLDEIQLSCRAMINCDLLRDSGEAVQILASRDLAALCEAAVAATGYSIEISHSTQRSADSDDASFRNVGIPTVWLLEGQTSHDQSQGQGRDGTDKRLLLQGCEVAAWVTDALVSVQGPATDWAPDNRPTEGD